MYIAELNKIKALFNTYMGCTINDKQADAIFRSYGTAKNYEKFLIKMSMYDKAGKMEQSHIDWLIRVDEQ